MAGKLTAVAYGRFEPSISFFSTVSRSHSGLPGDSSGNLSTRLLISLWKKSHEALSSSSLPVKFAIANKFSDFIPSTKNLKAMLGKRPVDADVKFLDSDSLMMTVSEPVQYMPEKEQFSGVVPVGFYTDLHETFATMP